MNIQFAKPEDLEEVRDLLKSADLPFEDIQDGIGHFLLAKDDKHLIGCVGLEICGHDALLRSLAVSKSARNQGLGKALLLEILEYASRLNLRNIYLFTKTKESFFSKHGFLNANRNEAPLAIQATSQYSSVCPSSAIFMSKEL
jgi:amino-acid N-acetyltransferase